MSSSAENLWPLVIDYESDEMLAGNREGRGSKARGWTMSGIQVQEQGSLADNICNLSKTEPVSHQNVPATAFNRSSEYNIEQRGTLPHQEVYLGWEQETAALILEVGNQTAELPTLAVCKPCVRNSKIFPEISVPLSHHAGIACHTERKELEAK